MNELRSQIERWVLPHVTAPAQYVGGELNAIVKNHDDVDVTVCLAFPDTYEIGMSHVGLQILYGTLNARPDVAAERVFAPWVDMADLLAERGLPLYSLETFTPLAEFDVIGFSLQYEMCYTNVLAMLELAGLPVRSADRDLGHPLIVAGGPCAFNPEPMADFVDVFAPGDGESVIHRLVDAFREAKPSAGTREALCRELVRRVDGLYAPALYERGYPRRPRYPEAPEVVGASVEQDLNACYYSTEPIVPFRETVHDRITLEIMRGCARGCRYCQAGMTRRPVRLRSVERLEQIAAKSYDATGHSEISLASLSSSDYPHLGTRATRLSKTFDPRGVGLALPSLRVDDQLSALPALVSSVRKSGLTLAPEEATERLRRVINKDISNEHLFDGLAEAFRRGWRRVKLYFMIGLPTETDEDILAIVGLVERASRLRREVAGGPAHVSVHVAPFVPKPHTP